MIAHTSSWMMVAENIIEEGYDQLIANPMRRTLTAEERTEKVNGKLKYASGGRCLEFASETLDVVTFECDKIPLELQLGVIRYLARHLPLVCSAFSVLTNHTTQTFQPRVFPTSTPCVSSLLILVVMVLC